MRSQGPLFNKIIHFYQHVLVKIGLWDGVLLHDDCKKNMYIFFKIHFLIHSIPNVFTNNIEWKERLDAIQPIFEHIILLSTPNAIAVLLWSCWNGINSIFTHWIRQISWLWTLPFYCTFVKNLSCTVIAPVSLHFTVQQDVENLGD